MTTRWLLALVFAGLLVRPAGATTEIQAGSGAPLVTAQTTTGASATCVRVFNHKALEFLYRITAGTATVAIEQCIEAKASLCDTHTSWVTVSGSSSATNLFAPVIAIPLGCYRTNVTACSSCSVTIPWAWQ